MTAASTIAFVVALYTSARFAVGSLSVRARWLDRDRLGSLTRLIEAVALLLLVRAFVDWTALGIVPWFALVAVTAAGAAGMVFRWTALPWLEDRTARRRRTLGAIGTVALAALFVGVVGV